MANRKNRLEKLEHTLRVKNVQKTIIAFNGVVSSMDELNGTPIEKVPTEQGLTIINIVEDNTHV